MVLAYIHTPVFAPVCTLSALFTHYSCTCLHPSASRCITHASLASLLHHRCIVPAKGLDESGGPLILIVSRHVDNGTHFVSHSVRSDCRFSLSHFSALAI
ncbi:hypothetical protein B0J13DRAFT_24899 [Dactylonectria estremocensis]|uniref:Uncharacterized protein n=1 Tax=Dactylonectria estremocensis TaxID=1079267 RepID=A0A9P9JLA8_9HYPO|nr:hypothetical protein B0J13DRAFT_24899 [Dactylonectria estremocensis]